MSATPRGRTWTAHMITPAIDLTAPMFRRELRLETGHGAVASATLHVSSLGVYEARINGRPIGDDVLSPGWSAYEWRLRHRTYDVVRPPRGRERPDRGRGQRLVPGAPGLHGRWRLLRRPSRPHRRARDHLRRRPPAAGRDRRLVDRLGVRHDRRRPLRRADDRRPETHRRLVQLRRDPRAHHARAPARVRHRSPGALPRSTRQPPRSGQAGPGVALPVWPHPGGLRPEPGRLGAVHRPWTEGRGDPRAARGGARARGARRPPAPQCAGHRPVHPQRRGRRVRADDDVPRLPVRRGRRVAGRDGRRADRGLARGRRRPLRPGAHRLLRVLRAAPQPAAPERGLGHQGQLPRPPDRLPATRRAARVDRRHRRLRTHGGVPLRRGPVPLGLARRPRPRAGARRRHGGVRRPGRPQAATAPGGVPGPRQHGHLERRGGVGPVVAVAGVRRPVGAGAPVRLHGRPLAPGRDLAVTCRPLGRLVPVR